jgi:lipopolysaccharide/colanic/teichoic acid biosynthesis glycosyltransferase
MKVDAEANGAQWAKKNDDRVTKFGKFMRKVRLDELPQLFNIFLGQMSIVGPRPERPEFYEEFETYIHGFNQRLKVKCGLTGHAQVNGGYDLLPQEKVLLDIEYIKKRSFFFDIKIMFQTIGVIFGRKGSR